MKDIIKKVIFLNLFIWLMGQVSFVRARDAISVMSPDIAVTDDSVFTKIDWPGGIGKEKPLFKRCFSVGQNYSLYHFGAHLEYPEYIQLTSAEKKILQEKGIKPADSIVIDTHLGVSRKSGILDLSFVPLVIQGDKWMRLVSCKIVIDKCAKGKTVKYSTTETASSSSSRYVSHSVLASGKWAKIRVKTEGIYALTKSFLSSLGFTDLSKVKVYGYGGRLGNDIISYGTVDGDYDDLEEVPLYRRTNDVLFFAEGTIRWSAWRKNYTTGCYISTHQNNPYSDYSYYFVTEGDSVMAFPKVAMTSSPTTVVTSVPYHVLVDHDEYSWYTSGRTLYESYNYGESGNSKNYAIATTNIDTTALADIYISMTAANTSYTTVTLSQNGTSVGTFNISPTGEYDHAMLENHVYNISHKQESSTFNIKTTSGHDARLDYLRVDFSRYLKMDGSSLIFNHYLSTPAIFKLSNATSNTQIWRIGNPGSPTALVPSTLSGTELQFTLDNPQLRYIAVDVLATFPTPEFVETVANQDLHADSACDMVIIIPESGKLLSQAERLAQVHKEKDGLRVKIVKANQIYNEFSSGTPDADAYRKYLKMFYDRATQDSDMPRYLLLMGASVWDNRMLTSECTYLDPKDYLLCYESDASLNEVNSYVTDDYFGYLDDGEGENFKSEKIDLGIGRIPVTTDADAKIIVDKCISYMNNSETGAWKNDIYMIADDGDANEHMEDEESVLEKTEESFPKLAFKRIYLDAYPLVSTSTGNTYPDVTTKLKSAMNKGALVMSYSGHGSPNLIAKEKVLTLADFKSFTSTKIPLWVVASCEITPFDMLEETIGEESMLNKKAAAIAFYSAARAVYSTQNVMLNRYYMYYIFAKDSNGKRLTLGDAARMTKVNLVSTTTVDNLNDYSENKLKYLLVGDPAITLAMPTCDVEVDKINGVDITSSTLPQLKAGSVVSITGHVSDNGAKMTNFNGTVTLKMMDSKDTVTCKNNQKDAQSPFVYSEYTKTLYEGSDSVKNGTFETKIPIPLDIKYTNLNGLLRLYAINNAKSIEANGYTEHFTVGGTDNTVATDSLGPSLFVYLNNPDFKDGGIVNEIPYFYANLSDSDGINATGNGVGHDLELVIDGEGSKTYVLNNYYTNDFGSYTKGSVVYQIPELAEGKHQLFFRAWDIKNNSSSTILNFIVKKGLLPSILSAWLTNNPASSATTFVINYDRPETETTFSIKVYDCFGRLWWTHQETGSSDGLYSINWNLTSNNGVVLPSGLYLYKVGISCNGSKENTKTQKLIIHKQ